MLTEQKRIFLLILIMTLVALVVGGVSIAMLYQAAFTEEEARLTEAAQSQARLIEAVARFNEAHQKQWHPDVGVPKEYTLDQIRDAHKNYVGFGKTGEFTLAQLFYSITATLIRNCPNPSLLTLNWPNLCAFRSWAGREPLSVWTTGA